MALICEFIFIVESRIKTQSRMKSAAFLRGLDQMKSLWRKVQSDSDISSSLILQPFLALRNLPSRLDNVVQYDYS